MSSYMFVRADWISTNGSSVMIKANGSFVEVGLMPESAVDGKPFCMLDCYTAGMFEGGAYFPVGDDGCWHGIAIDGSKVSLTVSDAVNGKIFSSFHAALVDAFGDMPIATATMHLRSFALNYMDEKQFASLSRRQLGDLMELSACCHIEDNMDNSMYYALPSDIDNEIKEILSPKKPARKQSMRM